MARQLGRVAGKIDKEVSLPDRDPDRHQPPFRRIEPFQHLGMPGWPQPAIQIVDPGMIGTLKPDQGAARLFHQGRAAMPANIEEGANLVHHRRAPR